MTTQKNSIYFDNAATTPVLPCALEKYIEVTQSTFGNPSSTHLLGRQALEKFEEAQEKIAHYLHVPPAHVIFTSGGTESNNLAIWGSLGGIEQEINLLKKQNEGQIISSVNEHDATKKTLESLSHLGAKVEWLKVDSEGLVLENQLDELLEKRTRLLTLHHGQNEVGTLQNIKSLSLLLRKKQPDALFHIDAIQSFLKIPLNLNDLGVDLISISGHKFGAPKGIAAVILGERFLNRKPKLGNLILGSSQQSGIRPGTIPVPLIASFAAAIDWGYKNLEENRSKILSLRSYFLKDLPTHCLINGPKDISEQSTKRTPQTINFSVPGFPSGMLVEALSAKGICISAGSACHAANPKPNETLLNLGLPKDRALTSIRVSFSHYNTKSEIDFFQEQLCKIIKQYC